MKMEKDYSDEFIKIINDISRDFQEFSNAFQEYCKLQFPDSFQAGNIGEALDSKELQEKEKNDENE